MAHRKRKGESKKLIVTLDTGDPVHQRIWEQWESLSKEGGAAQWVRDTLYDALPTEYEEPKANHEALMRKNAVPVYAPKSQAIRDIQGITDDDHNDPNEPHYEPIQE